MPHQHDFVVVEDADADKFPDYEMTHGLPKFIRHLDARTEGRTNLLTPARKEAIDFTNPKHPHLKASASLHWDAYLLWRLSERYAQEPFRIGNLDRDRVVRLRQLDVLEVINPAELSEATQDTVVRIRVCRQSLNDHFLLLQRNLAVGTV